MVVPGRVSDLLQGDRDGGNKSDPGFDCGDGYLAHTIFETEGMTWLRKAMRSCLNLRNALFWERGLLARIAVEETASAEPMPAGRPRSQETGCPN
jgi:hypothetical protein